jgi:branched-chain amino acid transport system ATP-binding protein
MLSLTGVSSGYSMIRVIKDVSLNVLAGHHVALVGPNGAGKTTLLETIAGFVKVRGGSIRFEDNDLGHLKPEERARTGIVLVPEKRNLFPDLTGGENLLLGRCSARGADCWSRAAVARASDRVFSLFPKLRDIADRPARVMSGGEQQMVAVGRALMAEPKLLMVDEPSQGLAPKLVQAMYEAIQGISKETTVLLVEQDMALARSVASEIHLILDGSIRRLRDSELQDERFLVREIFGAAADDANDVRSN